MFCEFCRSECVWSIRCTLSLALDWQRVKAAFTPRVAVCVSYRAVARSRHYWSFQLSVSLKCHIIRAATHLRAARRSYVVFATQLGL